jgi:dienelactone hydrolase
MFYYSDAQAAFDRSLKHGFRCARYGTDKVPAAALAELPLARREFGREKPASDEAFRAYKSMYAYDKGPLNSEVVAREEAADWVHESVRFDAAYGNERVIAHLFLPRNVRPPYQAIVFFPGINAKWDKMFPGSDKALYPVYLPRILKSGRAVLWPVYKGTFERRFGLRPGWSYTRDLEIQMAKDLRRSLDYLERRSDIDPSRIAYFGLSWGARLGNLFLAVEDRFRVAVLVSGGFPRFKEPLPEIDELNFAPRVTIPVLMINGRNDGIFEAKTAQRAMFELLGTPKEKKRHLLVDAEHTVPADVSIREIDAWLDRYLGQPKRLPE